MSGYDVEQLRSHFPSLASGIAHFDGPGGTQTPRQVGEAVAATLTGPLSNRGTSVASESNAESAIAAFRAALGDLLGTPADGIVYGRSATQLTYDFARALAKRWRPGDEVVVSRLDHDCNVRPWVQASEQAGATVRWLDFDPGSGELDDESIDEAITASTRLVAVTAASNLLGTVPPVARVADAAHAAGAFVYVDGVHYTAHHLPDPATIGADFFVCSPYKFLGPHCGVLAADPALLDTIEFDKLAPATNVVPERFELGTLPYETMAGAAAAVDFLAAIAPGAGATRRERLVNSFTAIDTHETRLRWRVEEGFAGFGDQVLLHSRAGHRTPTLFVTMPGRATADAAAFLADRLVLAPAGSFYAYEPFARLRSQLHLDDTGGLRVGLAPYTTDDEVDRLLAGLAEFLEVPPIRVTNL